MTELEAPLLIGRYQPLSLIARGGSSLVYRGRDEALGREVAIKLLASGTTAEVERFQAELNVLAGLSHHGIVSIYDAGVDRSAPQDPRPFLVMELVRGETLRTIIQAEELSVRRIGELAFEVAEALEYVHANGVIHRDITPSNIMLVDYGTTYSRPRARLTDFGIAIDGDGDVHPGGITIGTAAYLSPEQAKNEPLTPASDIYALGLVLLECFTRSVAFPGDAVESATARLAHDPEIPASIPKPWRTLIASMTERDPAARPDAAAVSDAARRELRAAHAEKKKR